MSLPAGSMISLVVALEGLCTIWPREGGERQVAAIDFVKGNHRNVLQPGDLLSRIELPADALRKRTAFRRISLTHQGRAAALLAGTLCPRTGVFMLTVTASTERPLRLEFSQVPGQYELGARLTREIPDAWYFDDVHGAPDYRKHITHYFAEQIRRELSDHASA